MANETIYTYLDSYCERAGDPGLWAEPLNAITNLFFIFAAILAGRALLTARPVKSVDLWLLVVLLFAIGVGSGLWHLFASKHTLLMDVIPITLFINAYLVIALRRLFALGWGRVAFWWLVYFGAGLVAQALLPPDMLNGTIMYIPTFLTLVVMMLALKKRDAASARVFQTVLLVWLASLTFRTVDLEICTQFPIGTHFLWHTLNAWVLWRLLVLLIARARG